MDTTKIDRKLIVHANTRIKSILNTVSKNGYFGVYRNGPYIKVLGAKKFSEKSKRNGKLQRHAICFVVHDPKEAYMLTRYLREKLPNVNKAQLFFR